MATTVDGCAFSFLGYDGLINCSFLYFGQAIRGIDNIHEGTDAADVRRWVMTLDFGELQINPTGGQSVLSEIWLRTYSEGGATTPDVICKVRSTDESSWWAAGDAVGTITLTEDTPNTCTGSGTAFSNTIGTDSGTAFSTPCLAANATFYRDSTLLVLGTDYTITAVRQVTLTSALTAGQTLYAYWNGSPFVVMKVNDYIETTYGFHRITAIPNATTLTLEWYPQAGFTSVTGSHRTAKQIPTGEGETVFGINRLLDTAQIEFLVIPRNSATAPTVVEPIGFTLVTIQSGERMKKSA